MKPLKLITALTCTNSLQQSVKFFFLPEIKLFLSTLRRMTYSASVITFEPISIKTQSQQIILITFLTLSKSPCHDFYLNEMTFFSFLFFCFGTGRKSDPSIVPRV